MRAITYTYVFHKRMGRCQTQSFLFVDDYFPTDIPRDRRFVERLQTSEISTVFYLEKICLSQSRKRIRP